MTRETGGRRVAVFFYGLFMDEDILRAKGADPRDARRAWVEEFSLVIGRRAALIPAPGARSYGMVMRLDQEELGALYSAPDLQAYRPEAVLAETFDGERLPVLCYNLVDPPQPADRNGDYATQLREVLARLAFPPEYVASV
jgi:hypothetical protein